MASDNRIVQALSGLALVCMALTGCSEREPAATSGADGGSQLQCEPDNAGLVLPENFCVRIFAEHVAHLRHLAVNDEGIVYAAQRNRRLGIGGIAVLTDENSDGRSDRLEEFSDQGVTGLLINNGYLYAGEDERIVRWSLAAGATVPQEPAQVVVTGLPASGYHGAKALALDSEGALLVNIGAPSNACQRQDREPGSPGLDPCPELAQAAGIWRFDANRLGAQFPGAGERYASGIRHTIAMAWSPQHQSLYVVQHGRDELAENWPEIFNEREGEQAPAEIVLRVSSGSEFGWPYCYFDPGSTQYRLAPEYGGDGVRDDRCQSLPAPYAALAAHSGPNDMIMYDGEQFPERYRGGFFVALHGAVRRSSGTGVGYQIAYVPLVNSGPAVPEVFADGFAGTEPANPRHRPTGLAQGPDGELYVADSVAGRIYRIDYLAP